MATEVAGAVPAEEALADEARPRAVPYPPSWVDRLITWLEDRPGPTWLAYLALGVLGFVLALIAALLTGHRDPLVIAANVFWGVFVPFTLLLLHHLARVAGTAFDAFAALLDASPDERARLRYELTVVPPRPALAILLFSAVFTPVYWIVDPEGAAVVGYAPAAFALRFVTETVFGALLLVFLWQSFRQLAAVNRIHARATVVDLFRPAPLYAFSTLTSRTAIVLALAFTLPSAVSAWQARGAESDLIFIGYALVGVVAGAVVFVVPLIGMQRRITAEKRRLQGEVGARLESTIDAVHAAVDRGDLEGAGAMNGALGVLVTERDLVDRLPTFPWRPGTLGAVATAILLPLVLSVATRLLERVV